MRKIRRPQKLLPGRKPPMPDSKVPELLTGALKFGIKPGLERITTLMNLLGNPQDSFKSVHIAGTNGKGSVATFISSVMAASGKTVGVFTSPYLERFSERIRIIDGKEGLLRFVEDDSYGEIDPASLSKFSDQVKAAREKMVSKGLCDEPTEFELITAISFLYFAEKKIDVAVLEVGLGGRLDSTNIIKDPLVTVITAMGLDHTGVLGSTIKEITGEKAGIFKEGSPAVCFDPDLMILPEEMKPDVRSVLLEKASEKKIGISFAGSKAAYDSAVFTEDGRMEFTYDGTVFSTYLNGRHQIGNAVTAIEACRKCGIPEDAIKEGIAFAEADVHLLFAASRQVRRNLHILCTLSCGKADRSGYIEFAVIAGQRNGLGLGRVNTGHGHHILLHIRRHKHISGLGSRDRSVATLVGSRRSIVFIFVGASHHGHRTQQYGQCISENFLHNSNLFSLFIHTLFHYCPCTQGV